MSKLPYYLASGLLFSTSALALEAETLCQAQPSCESLGYSKTIPTNCTNILKCPFDTNYQKCLDCNANECPSGYTRVEACLAQGGIGLYNTLLDGCVMCKLCPEDYRWVSANQANWSTCETTSYRDFQNSSYKCCAGCPTGTVSEEECTAQNGILNEDTAVTSGTIGSTYKKCGECLTCSGTIYPTMIDSYSAKNSQCSYLDPNKTQPDKDPVCCEECNQCPGGKLISSQDEISGPGTYCLNTDLTVSNKQLYGGAYIFKNTQTSSGHSCSKGKLILDQVWGEDIRSEVYVTIEQSCDITSLQASNGGQFNSPFGGTLSINLTNGIYYITSQPSANNDHDTKVTCSQSATVDYSYIRFEEGMAANWANGYYFDSSCNGKLCKIDGDSDTVYKHIKPGSAPECQ